MRVFYGFEKLTPLVRPVITVGSYDGVHAGHRELLGRIVKMAHDNGGESVVITFSPHPRIVLSHGKDHIELLNSLKEKIFLLEQVGIDNLIVAPFTEEFSNISSYDFVHDYLIGKIGVGTLVFGYNHHFGHNKEGNFAFLEHLQAQFGFNICEVSPQRVDNDKVSSTIIRTHIANGEIGKASKFLAHPYFIIATGVSNGKIESDEPHKLLPPAGKYAVTTSLDFPTVHTLIIDDGRKMILTEMPNEHTGDFMINFV